MSLVEILVVMAVVSILAVMVVSGAQDYFKKAGNAKCVSNLRNIGAAMGSYLQEHGVYPYHISGNTRWVDGNLAPDSFFAGPYLQVEYWTQRASKGKSPSAKGGYFDCPVMKVSDKSGTGDTEWTEDYFDYAQNLTLCGRRSGSITAPSQTVLVAEGGSYARVKAKSTAGLTYSPQATSNPGGTAWDFNPTPLRYAHGEGANFLFADGHVAWHREEELTEKWFDGK